ncbi:hypothetical protein WS83_00315 [Burkholderia sp. MSMB2042]|nr:hypothetical protein WS86_24880 [Burkholderia savannae]KVG37094.1 hypothetical protein WS77_22870 [Burkholderia sp. MSMB0265]KVG94152.1 hypothetical protein WS83_00315 [Burkholderia sp. MSMB2042]KVG97638.1 hypothetical protein WS82_27940 [Burkholderia sp. MSMB2041]KVK84325.1 hypothetical protein WS91_05065 [Burkholderia sp. MSMB1498]
MVSGTANGVAAACAERAPGRASGLPRVPGRRAPIGALARRRANRRRFVRGGLARWPIDEAQGRSGARAIREDALSAARERPGEPRDARGPDCSARRASHANHFLPCSAMPT